MNDVSGRGERLEALAKRVERYAPAGRYDFDLDRRRELNEAIAIAIGLPLTQRLGDPALGNDRVVPTRISDYVGSIDAATTLVPNGRDWMVDNFDGYHDRRCSASVFNEAGASYKDYEARAATSALALTAACLRAIAHQDLAQSPNIAGGGE